MLRIIVALMIIGHGIGHIMGFLAAWTRVPMGFTDRPWIFSSGVTIGSALGRAFGLLWLVAMVATVASGIGLLIRADWWPPLAIVGSIISLLVIAPWWNTVAPGPRFWASLVDLIILAALLLPWRETVLEMLGR